MKLQLDGVKVIHQKKCCPLSPLARPCPDLERHGADHADACGPLLMLKERHYRNIDFEINNPASEIRLALRQRLHHCR